LDVWWALSPLPILVSLWAWQSLKWKIMPL
jgi:hypothetical protein